jgi:hypothetical protein
MKARNVFGLMLSVVLLLVAVGSSLARETQPTEPSEAVGVNASSAANAPWFNIDVDTPGDVGQYTSVAIDPFNNTTYVSYYDATNKRLRMAMNSGFGSGGNCGPDNSWLCQTVDSGADFGKYSSIAIKPVSGGGIYYPEIGIAYYDATNGKLKYAYAKICPTCSWSKDTIDQPILFPTDNIGRYTSLKFNSNGTPYIAYYFENTGGVDALKVASMVASNETGNCGYGSAAGEWQCDTIKTGEGVGQYASLALDGAGNMHIAFYDAANGDLWYASDRIGTNCGPGGNKWICYPVDALGNVGQYASLYVDNGNHFHIAYYNATNDALKYAVDVGDSSGNCGVLGSVQCDTIDSMPTGYHPLGVSMAEFYAGYPIIAYQSKDGSLNVARPAAVVPGKFLNCGLKNVIGYTWYCETIKPYYPLGPVRHGDFVSIALSSSGLATIAYYGFIFSSEGNLMVAYQRFTDFLPLVMNNH